MVVDHVMYDIIHGTVAKDVAREVNLRLSQGWELHGPLVVEHGPTYQHIYQSIIKRTPTNV